MPTVFPCRPLDAVEIRKELVQLGEQVDAEELRLQPSVILHLLRFCVSGTINASMRECLLRFLSTDTTTGRSGPRMDDGLIIGDDHVIAR